MSRVAGSGGAGRNFLFSFALAASLAQVSCTRQPAVPAVERLAVLRFENLSSDPASDWVGRAFQEILDAELAGAPELYAIPSSRLLAMDRALGARPVAAPGISAGQAAALSLGATRIGYGDYTIRNGRLEAHLSLADPRKRRIVAEWSAEAGGGDVLAAAGALARRISPRASGYATRSEAALHAYIDALDAGGQAEAESRAEAALEGDPGFAPAARLLAGLRVQRGDRAGALDCLDRALASKTHSTRQQQGGCGSFCNGGKTFAKVFAFRCREIFPVTFEHSMDDQIGIPADRRCKVCVIIEREPVMTDVVFGINGFCHRAQDDFVNNVFDFRTFDLL